MMARDSAERMLADTLDDPSLSGLDEALITLVLEQQKRIANLEARLNWLTEQRHA